MKKTLIIVQIIILLLIIVKVASFAGLPKKTADMLPSASFMTSPAMAQQTGRLPSTSSADLKNPLTTSRSASESAKDSLAKERDLADALLSKKEELDKRENSIRTEEQRLLALRKEIIDKIALLKIQEDKLTASLDAGMTSETKRYKEMAKVYEATPAAKAGSMLEKLDIRTAAGITMNMKKDKAGAIWGYLSPQKAVEITREITNVGKQQTE